jgi:uncharacterized surface protein with fasciclin (FAS1) repeats
MKKTNKRKLNRIQLILPFLLAIILFATTGCRDLLEDRAPGWLGSSIYDNLKKDGQFNNTAKLIEDLNYKDVLARTGSKTLFVADDNAFEEFFSKNDWGVRKYEDLSLSQKKLLLFGSMINNSYQLNTLANSQGPTIGDCMRRMTALSIYDSVPVMDTTEMPHSIYWSQFRHEPSSTSRLFLMKDFTIQPMIHFIETQLNRNNITNDDYDFLMNHTTHRSAGDASVNGVPVVSANVKCSNGFVHQMDHVMLPLTNMAEIIRTKKTTTGYSKLLERFCAPYYSVEASKELNRLNNTTNDSVFQKRYFSLRSQNGATLSLTPDNKSTNGTLKFDPGWNAYFPNTATGTLSNVAMQQDMAVMLVPSDAALDNYWNNGSGEVLKDYYGTWDKVPDMVISKLLNNNMLNMFQSSVPSKFANILDDAINPMGITESDIDSVYLGCNGAVYLTNKVFSPTAYISVGFPALVNPQMWVINWAIGQLKYDAYLNAMKARYSFFIPKNGALLHYIDPVSFGKTSTQKFKFYYDGAEPNENNKVKASVWNYNVLTQVEDSVRMATYSEIINRLEDILDSHTVIGEVDSGNSFYKTKGGSTLKVFNPTAGAGGMTVSGGYQLEQKRTIPVSKVYVQGNGKAYILEDEPIQTAQNSVFDILSQHSEFSKFLELLNGSGFLVNLQNNHSNPSQNISFFSRFQYTIYVPLNDSITALETRGVLPTWDEIENETDTAVVAKKTEIIRNFLKYHIQDNSVFVDTKLQTGAYETAVMNNTTKTFYTTTLKVENNTMTVTDKLGNVRHVITNSDPDLHNLIAREYMYDSSDKTKAYNIFSSANVVVHQIDGVLMYDKNQFK